jgi:hypothetical protein
MKNDKSHSQGTESKAERLASKKARLAALLRQNLPKRKQQTQMRKSSSPKDT